MRFRKLKKQTKLKQNQKVQSEVLYATIADKIKAFITDMFMIYIPILYVITYLVMGGKDEFQASDLAPFMGVSLYGFIYSILLYKFAQTPGNRAYTMRVVDAKSYKNVTFFQALLRFVGFLFTSATLLGLLVPFYRKDKRSLHDLIARTVVLADKN